MDNVIQYYFSLFQKNLNSYLDPNLDKKTLLRDSSFSDAGKNKIRILLKNNRYLSLPLHYANNGLFDNVRIRLAEQQCKHNFGPTIFVSFRLHFHNYYHLFCFLASQNQQNECGSTIFLFYIFKNAQKLRLIGQLRC